MINAIIEAVSIALDAEFGNNYTIMREESRQDLKEPCFFISCLNPTIKLFRGRRYFRKNLFCIQYFPESGNRREECSQAAERMFFCLEYIHVSGELMRGTSMNYEIVDGVMNFFVNYDCFVYKMQEETPMETVKVTNNLRE